MTSLIRASAACAAACLFACATGIEAGSNRPGTAISVASDASTSDAGTRPPPPSDAVPDGGGVEFPPNPAPDGGTVCLAIEQCSQTSDLDCDGLIGCADPDCASHPDCGMECTYTTERCDVGGCNGHLGDDLAACMAEGNPGGCSADELHGWCTRRVTPGPGGPWYEAVRRWVDDRCSGAISMTIIDGYEAYVCRDEGLCREFVCTTPLVLALDGDVPPLVCDTGAAAFDLSAAGDGSMTRTDWVPPELPWLALDRDGDGRITSGRELFGSATLLGSGGTSTHGFAALADLDDDQSGAIDANDSAFGGLVAWYDRDSNRQSSPDELVPLSALGIDRLALDHEVAPECDSRGNCAVERSAFGWTDGTGASRSGALVDLHLAVHGAAPR